MAMKKKCKCPPAGAPDWMVTYGDMVTLLLCFFVLIVSFSEIKKEDEYNAVVEAIQKAFGMKGGGGKMQTEDDPALSMQQRLETMALQQQHEPNRSNTQDPGMDGPDPTITTVREGMKFVVGGQITFETGSAELSHSGKQQLDDIAQRVKGENNLIDIKGHTTARELSGLQDSPYKDLWDLSNARAKAVFDYLTRDDVGLNPSRFRLIANADREPLAHKAYTDANKRPNRRAEVLVTENLISDFNKAQPSLAP